MKEVMKMRLLQLIRILKCQNKLQQSHQRQMLRMKSRSRLCQLKKMKRNLSRRRRKKKR